LTAVGKSLSPCAAIAAQNDITVSIRNLRKVFHVYRRPSDYFKEMLTRRPHHIEKVALKDVSFDVCRGQIVGIIGRNGAGKSTLLKIIAGIMDYDAGSVEVHGRVSSILELGTGFHPDYSGRENIELGATVLGMTPDEIATKMDSIIDFSELRAVIDEPFRTYSTGMQARLTFATAISIEPDLLIVDEALSVGDLLFQEKCFRRIRAMAKAGVTILFVTHALAQIYDLCSHAFLFSNGVLIESGKPRFVGYAYERLLAEDRERLRGGLEAGVHYDVAGKTASTPAIEPKAKILKYEIVNEDGSSVGQLYRGQIYRIRAYVKANEDIANASIGFRIERPTGLVVYGVASTNLGVPISLATGEEKLVEFSFRCLLQNGPYVLGGGVANMHGESEFSLLHVVRGGLEFEVSGVEYFQGLFDGGSRVISVISNLTEGP
jgi:ABC-type polysaccharide/polyol phosphate transport system ATPase subunit